MEFLKYIHLERFGTDNVEDINFGECHIFPKLDGTNGSAWWSDWSGVCGGSRNRLLSLDADNQGFYEWLLSQENWRECLQENKDLRFYGEWLVPHSLKTYRDDAWRKFYVFDVVDANGRFMHYDDYKLICERYDIDYIPCILKSRNPTYEMLHKEASTCTFLLNEGESHGEGIVIKNYGFENKFGNITWAKLITSSFKDKHIKEMGGKEIDSKMVEEDIVNEFITSHLVEKVIAKIRNSEGSFNAKSIPRLLSTTYHDLVTEELWQALKKHKNPKIDFKALSKLSIIRVKQLKPEIFGI
tara:strand:+ start:1701 stop:2597 length:897 start_codon:yes stop_codon:yes gene_type:complete